MARGGIEPVTSTWTVTALCVFLFLLPVLAYIIRELWAAPEVPLVLRLLWARAKEAAGIRVSSRKLTAELIAVAREYKKKPT
jgi:hypothetical protein